MCFPYLFVKFFFSSCLLPFLSFINSASVSFRHLLIRYHRYIIIITQIHYCYYYCFFPCYKHVFDEMRLKQNKKFVSMISCSLSPEPTPPPHPPPPAPTVHDNIVKAVREAGRGGWRSNSIIPQPKGERKEKKKKKKKRKKGRRSRKRTSPVLLSPLFPKSVQNENERAFPNHLRPFTGR